jgi:hypothetical protein
MSGIATPTHEKTMWNASDIAICERAASMSVIFNAYSDERYRILSTSLKAKTGLATLLRLHVRFDEPQVLVDASRHLREDIRGVFVAEFFAPLNRTPRALTIYV